MIGAMKGHHVFFLATLGFAGCGSKEQPPAKQEPVVRAAVTDPIGFCERARMLVQARRKCFPEDTSLRMALDEIADYASSAPAEPEARRGVARKCAHMLDGMMRAQQPANCPLDVLDSERQELAAFLEPAAAAGSAAAKP
jgi:hypothetical protein